MKRLHPTHNGIVGLRSTGLVQDCCISSALAMEILYFCTKPSNSFQKIWLAMLNKKGHHISNLVQYSK